jgi:hypothetical protein
MVWREWDLNPASTGWNLVCSSQSQWVVIFLNLNLVSGCRQSKVWIKRPCLKLARFLRNLPRTKLGVLIGLLTGHIRLNKLIHRMSLLSDPTCAACGIEEESFYMRVPTSGKPNNLDFLLTDTVSSFVQFADLRLVFNET